MLLWRLPGYVGGVPEQPVSREVVAVMARADEGERAHWRADFWIADADAAAARATQLGGSVLAGPEDAGPFREAVLADPAGATFSVSQLTGAASSDRHVPGPVTTHPSSFVGVFACRVHPPERQPRNLQLEPGDTPACTKAEPCGRVRTPGSRVPLWVGELPEQQSSNDTSVGDDREAWSWQLMSVASAVRA
jgi:hypothetical protein